MNSVLLVGAGKIGQAVARELLETTGARILAFDTSPAATGSLRSGLGDAKNKWADRCVVLGHEEVSARLPEVDGFILCVPWPNTKSWLERLLRGADGTRGRPIVSITRPDYEDIPWLQRLAGESQCPVLLPVGLEPGLVELIATSVCGAVSDLDELTTCCGGIPAAPAFPLCHALFFGERLAIDDRDAWYVRRGVPSLASRFSDLRRITVEGVGVLEAYHDGMMPTTAQDSRFRVLNRFEQRTLRWPGFVERMLHLKELGFFSDEDVNLDGCRMKPRDFTHHILRPLLAANERDHDIAIVHVAARRRDGAEGTMSLLCRGEPKRTALAFLTSAVAVASLRRGAQPGWHPPTAQLFADCLPSLLERLQASPRVELRTSGILAGIFATARGRQTGRPNDLTNRAALRRAR